MGKGTSLRLVSRLALILAMALAATAARADAGKAAPPTELELARQRDEAVERARKALAAAATPAERIEASDALGNALLAQPDEKAWAEAAALFKGEVESSGGPSGYKGLLTALFGLHRDTEMAEILQSLRKDGRSDGDIRQVLLGVRYRGRSDDDQQINAFNERLHSLDPNVPLQVGGKLSRPKPLNQPRPESTVEARRHLGFKGTVIVETIVDADGRIRSTRVLKGQPWGLTESAVDALKAWTFEPATLNGTPVPVWYVLTITYQFMGG